MFQDQNLAALLDAATPAAPTAAAEPTGPAPGTGHRLRKVGGIIGGATVFTAAFLEIEHQFMRDARHCVMCGTAAREDDRMMCPPCQAAQRPPRKTPAEREAAKARSFEIARQRAREGMKPSWGAETWL